MIANTAFLARADASSCWSPGWRASCRFLAPYKAALFRLHGGSSSAAIARSCS